MDTSEYDLTLLCIDSTFSLSHIKRYIKRIKVLGENCSECGLSNQWNGKPIVHQIDHINGIPTDNRRENLRLLCPNCHSQTPTFAGANARKAINLCAKCNIPVKQRSIHCKKCAPRKAKISWPCKEELKKLVWEFPTRIIAQSLKISDKALEKQCKKLQIPKPPRGYWAKIRKSK